MLIWVAFLDVMVGSAELLYRAWSPVRRASEGLRSSSSSQRGMALWGLAQFVPAWEREEAYRVLKGALSDSEPNVRMAAAEGLRFYPEHYDESLPLILDLVKDGEHQVRERTLFVLEQMVKPVTPEAAAVTPAIIATLKDPKPNVWLEASRALFVIGQGLRAVPALAQLVHDCRGSHRLGALGFLLRMKQLPMEIEPDLREMLASQDAWERIWGAAALIKMGRAELAIPVLHDLLKSGNIDARLAAAQSLLSVGQVDAALTAVREAENHPDARIRARAAVIQEEMKKEIDTERNDQ
jgi:HEAT repeat protein